MCHCRRKATVSTVGVRKCFLLRFSSAPTLQLRLRRHSLPRNPFTSKDHSAFFFCLLHFRHPSLSLMNTGWYGRGDVRRRGEETRRRRRKEEGASCCPSPGRHLYCSHPKLIWTSCMKSSWRHYLITGRVLWFTNNNINSSDVELKERQIEVLILLLG